MTIQKKIISRNSRRFFFFFIGLFSKTLRRIFYANNIKRNHKFLAVCGRGYSAKKFFLKDYVSHTKVYLSNFTSKDLPRFSDYLKLRNKDISIVASINEWTPNIFYCLFLDLRETILARPYNLINPKTSKSVRETFRFDALGLKVRGITNGKLRNKFPLSLGNNGLLALYEACLYAQKNNIRNIFIYGMDLYSEDKCIHNSLREECDSYETFINLKKVNEKLSKQMDYLISLYPDIKFKNFTLNRYSFESKNIESIYVDI